MEITRLEYSSFFSKSSKFHAHLRNGRKNAEKVFCFREYSTSSYCVKFSMFRREHLSLVVNVLTNSVKILDQTKSDFVLLDLPQIHEKIG